MPGSYCRLLLHTGLSRVGIQPFIRDEDSHVAIKLVVNDNASSRNGLGRWP